MKIQPRLIILALLGVTVLAFGVALNNCSGLGNDSIAIFYDGIKHVLHLDATQLGTASTIVNVILLVLLWFTDRKFVNIGTLIQILPYGFVVNFSSQWLVQWVPFEYLWVRILGSVLGCLLLFVGVGLYIAVNIGVDPFTGLVMMLAEKLRWQFRITKILFDCLMITVGALLGGAIGAVTLVTALTAGPCMQFFSGKFRPLIHGQPVEVHPIPPAE